MSPRTQRKLTYTNILILTIVGLITLLLGLAYFSKQATTKDLVAHQGDLTLIDDPRLSGLGEIRVEHLCDSGNTVFDSLIKTADSVQFREYTFGKRITSINTVAQTNTKVWVYSVDGVEVSVSPEKYVCKGGEAVVWELK